MKNEGRYAKALAKIQATATFPMEDMRRNVVINGLPHSFRRSNFCKDHRDKIEVPHPLVVEDLISVNLNNRRK